MKKNNVEDIYIGDHENNARKGKKGIIVIFMLLVIVLIACVAGYLYITMFSKQSKKQVFVSSISNTNMEKVFNIDDYNKLINRILNEDSKIDSKLTFSTSDEELNSDGIDFSKLEFNISAQNDMDNEKSYTELGIKYSDNEMFKLKVLTNEDAIGLASDEIVNKYVGVHYDKIKDVFGIDFDEKDLEDFINADEQITLSSEEKNEYFKKYAGAFFENVNEENFETNDNIVLEKDGQSKNVVSYTLKLSQEELNTNLVNVLNALKNDEEFLSKISKSENSNAKKEENSNKEENKVEDNLIVPLNTVNIQDETNSSENTLIEEGESNNFNSSLELNEENTDSSNDITVNDITLIDSLDLTPTDAVDDENIEETYSILTNILLGNKVNKTKEELKNEIDKLIQKVNSLKGDGLEITVYVSDVATEKISTKLPDKTTIDIEFSSADANNNTMQITILAPEGSQIKNSVATYSADDEIAETNANDSSIDGFKIVLNKVSNDTNSTFNVTYSLIENKKINTEVKIKFQMNGASSANTVKNDISVVAKTDEAEYTVNLENAINFTGLDNIDDLTDDNCLFLENLSEDEMSATMFAIIGQAMKVYEEKVESLNFYDTNSNSSSMMKRVEDVSTSITKEEAKKALFDTVSNMMGEAQENGEEFSIKNLKDLKIDDLNVSTTLSDDEIVIVVDTYTFKITSGFELLEVE